MKRQVHNILVTGGAGFIGINFIRMLFGRTGIPEYDSLVQPNEFETVVNADCLTYAAQPQYLYDIEKEFGGKKYFFEKASIQDKVSMEKIFSQYKIDAVVHFAAESHVDRSIDSPEAFYNTNILGTCCLLELARKYGAHFHHISTDEVYGSLEFDSTSLFTEHSQYKPSSPYSASKASADMIALSYWHTYNLSLTMTNCSNNYGPFQHKEKLIPKTVDCLLNGKNVPIYGNGKNVRDWIFVLDHTRAVWKVLTDGESGSRYNVGANMELENNSIVEKIIHAIHVLKTESVDCESERFSLEELHSLIEYVKDRPGHDARYAIDSSLIQKELGWKPLMEFNRGIMLTAQWYAEQQKN